VTSRLFGTENKKVERLITRKMEENKSIRSTVQRHIVGSGINV
jgi:hypothetical protein